MKPKIPKLTEAQKETVLNGKTALKKWMDGDISTGKFCELMGLPLYVAEEHILHDVWLLQEGLKKVNEFRERLAMRHRRQCDIVNEYRGMVEQLRRPAGSVCVMCGCSDFNACPGGCYWMIKLPHGNAGVCSRCSAEFLQAQFSLAQSTACCQKAINKKEKRK